VAEIERDVYDDPMKVLRDARAQAAALPTEARAQRLQAMVRQVLAANLLERTNEVAAVLPQAQALARHLQARDLQCLLRAAGLFVEHEAKGRVVMAESAAQAVREARAGTDAWCAPRLLEQLSAIQGNDGHQAAALEAGQAAEADFQAAGESLMLAVVRSHLAWTLRERDDDTEAIQRSIAFSEQALAGIDPQHSRRLAVDVLYTLVGARIAAKNWSGARRDAAEAERRAHALESDPILLAYIRRQQGEIELRDGKPELALARLSEANRAFVQSQDDAMIVTIAALQAQALVALHRPSEALRVLAAAEQPRMRQALAKWDVPYFRMALEAHAALQHPAATAASARAYADALQRRQREENRRLATELQERYASAQREIENRLLRGEQEVQRTRLMALGALLGLAGLLVACLVVYLVQQRRLRTKLQRRTEELDASRRTLRELGAHNALLLEEERKSVARELHDELGQQLVALRMEMAVMKAGSEAGREPSTAQWQTMRERIDHLTTSMRSLVTGLRPPALDGGLPAALEWLGAEYKRTTGVHCEVEVDADVRVFKPEVQTMVFRVAQESLNNIMRHAVPGRVSLHLHNGADGWDLCVTDDGIGFDTASPKRGFGLLSMEERAQLLGGTLRIDSVPGDGTRVHLHLPRDTATEPAPLGECPPQADRPLSVLPGTEPWR